MLGDELDPARLYFYRELLLRLELERAHERSEPVEIDEGEFEHKGKQRLPPMVIKCCLFDIGGVAVGSPIVGVLAYERTHSLPPNYLNAAITAQGHQGAFQRLERSELPLHEFYELFGAQLSDVARGNAVYKRYCAKMGIGE